MKRKILSMILTSAMALSLCISANAAPVTSDSDVVLDTIEVGDYTIEILPGNPSEFMTQDKVLYRADWYEGADEFEFPMDCVLGEGNAVNIWIDNRQGNGDLTPIFYLDGTEVADSRFRLPQGQQQTYRIQNGDKSQMDNHIEVHISSYDYHMMYFQFAARQFDYVG